MKHAQRKSSLRPRHLIVIKLHRIDGPAAELVVLRIRAKHGAQQNTSMTSLEMGFHFHFERDSITAGYWPGGKVCGDPGYITKILRGLPAMNSGCALFALS
jgi:hypothetical protein